MPPIKREPGHAHRGRRRTTTAPTPLAQSPPIMTRARWAPFAQERAWLPLLRRLMSEATTVGNAGGDNRKIPPHMKVIRRAWYT